jgi:PhzF family phenazine biosynthesis protein
MGMKQQEITLPLYQVDAFTSELFAGNPAAVCLLSEAISPELMQSIAAENNLAETAFVRLDTQPYELRWFTPTIEVALCGHATLAAAFVLFNQGLAQKSIEFQSLQSGILTVSIENELLTLDFPADEINPTPISPSWHEMIGAPILEAYTGKTDLILRLDSAESVRNLAPDLSRIERLPYRGVIVTAKGEGDIDFVSRFFGPAVGVPEDPVTGSAHTSLVVYWSQKLKKSKLKAKQESARGGSLICELKNGRAHLSGAARLYLKGEIYVPNR